MPSMHTDWTTARFDFGEAEGRRIEAGFDGGTLTSNAGALLLGKVDDSLQLIERLAACFLDHRDPALIEHSLATLLKQRLIGLSRGYETPPSHRSPAPACGSKTPPSHNHKPKCPTAFWDDTTPSPSRDNRHSSRGGRTRRSLRQCVSSGPTSILTTTRSPRSGGGFLEISRSCSFRFFCLRARWGC